MKCHIQHLTEQANNRSRRKNADRHERTGMSRVAQTAMSCLDSTKLVPLNGNDLHYTLSKDALFHNWSMERGRAVIW